MPTQLLSCGIVHSVLQNVVYALPACTAIIYCDAVSPLANRSTTVTFTDNNVISFVGGQATVNGGFFRPQANLSVVLRRV